MFDEPIDMLLVEAYTRYQATKEALQEDAEFRKSKERKQLDKFYEAIVVLWEAAKGRR